MSELYSDIFTRLNKQTTVGSKTSYSGIPIAGKLNQKHGQEYPLLDAVDIDWDGARLESFAGTQYEYLYTTYDLIKVLNRLNSDDSVAYITKNIEDIYQQLNEIAYSYITTDSLNEILDDSWQRKLSGGEFIGIDQETNTVYAYGLPTYEYLADTYTTAFEHRLLVDRLESNYWTSQVTQERISYNVSYTIAAIVADAPETFDTLKEIADWILDQNEYLPVDKSEVAENWKENLYFYKESEEDTEYKPVPSPEFVKEHPDYLYYRVKNYLTDIADLLERVDNLEESDKQFLSYINTINFTLKLVDDHLSTLDTKTESALQTAKNADEKADEAIETANTAKNTADSAYSNAETAQETANKAIEDSAYAVTKVIELDAEVNTLAFNVALMDDRVTSAQQSADTALYRLDVDNTNSTFVNLNLDPDRYDESQPNKFRTLQITTTEGSVDPVSGIISDGLVNITTCSNMYTYLSGWLMLGVNDEDDKEYK